MADVRSQYDPHLEEVAASRPVHGTASARTTVRRSNAATTDGCSSTLAARAEAS